MVVFIYGFCFFFLFAFFFFQLKVFHLLANEFIGMDHRILALLMYSMQEFISLGPGSYDSSIVLLFSCQLILL